jgi:hypothetical protein
MMLRLLILLLLPLPALAGDGWTPRGNWVGTGHQDGETWAMEVQFAEGGARVDYPGLPCGGFWILDTDNQFVIGVERLTYGQQLCWDGLAVRVSPAEGGLQVKWFDDIGAEIAHARLTRVAGEKTATGKK